MGKRKSQEEFENDVLIKLGPDYKVMGAYPGAHGKVELKHFTCGNIFFKNVHDIISKGSGCPYCNGNRNALYTEDWVKNNTPKSYKYIQGYQKMTVPCEFYCENCKSNFFQQPQRLINQHIFGCNCQKNKKKTHEQFLEELGIECLQEYDFLEEYCGADTKIKIQHKACNTIFEISPYKFIHKHNKKYCPICYYKKSSGEILINDFLNKNQIEYCKEFIFPNLNDKRFDFYLPELNMCIEYDGEQHFFPNEFFGGEQGLIETQRRDKEKNIFCLENNIILIRIPYNEKENIHQILNDIIKEKSSTTIEKFQITEQSSM